MVGRPQVWFPFRDPALAGYRWSADGRIADQSDNVLSDRHRLFSRLCRAEILAREWLGPPPIHDCIWCGTRKQWSDGTFRGPIRGGGPRYRIVHLDDNPRNCHRDNLKYEPDREAIHSHNLVHAEIIMHEVPPRRVKQPAKDFHDRTKPLRRRIDGPPRMPLAEPGPGVCRSSAFKIRGEHSVPDQTREVRLLSMPTDRDLQKLVREQDRLVRDELKRELKRQKKLDRRFGYSRGVIKLPEVEVPQESWGV